MLPSAVQNLLDYYRPLCTFSHGWAGGESLLAPGTNLLGANAAYLSEDADESVMAAARDWAEQHDLPPLRVRLGSAGDAGTLRVGAWRAAAGPSAIQVEQTSRLHLPRWADVLAEAYGQAEWAAPIARHLAARLEGLPDAVLLLAYAGSEPVGALLWQPCGAHLWGTLDEAVDAPLLSAAADLGGGELSVSLPDSSPLSVTDGQTVGFGRML
ncbi:hypothetical protein GCM10022631_32980 [Deinococcus rubellus]|uniref:GNAT family N-acetyltransferase n=1 Tax=Deinococcus rubellus TaxID=1889240 RepID=A0ABY5YET5_9DEIO|nr:hypothetical protein [Deinococcus rubellus]UWX63226.1 hypothetical protein N0D28_10745 [Deinococcus rubellus]